MNGWSEYLLAWICFLAAHMVPAAPGPRGLLIARLGRRGYLLAFSLVSVALLIWLVRASSGAPYVGLSQAGTGSRWLVNLAMPVAILTGAIATGMSGLLMAFAIWAAAHLVANGDLAHAILFGGMLVFAGSGLIRSGFPCVFRPSVLRIVAAIGLWIALLLLHPVVVGVSPLPG
ncbi:NnrU family protein [Paracoccus sp. R12_1]|uniref:NnrU family protein n=1 Tax=unclassified Paracoccus (in: a-proteobacteria) TaxID=2688777 RepID=UPI001ADD431B|nr:MULTISPECIES: NnrU family protein [unclassified Paracoccus (in: a-proteobacteria)]MBO9453773.1 NnrU family protein [Paracoccus sp. R12_2]MBO9486803.1 NnrU family protein [Paracoccus sp. R12_1]